MSRVIPEINVFASGGGSNFHAILDSIKKKELNAKVRCLITDRNCGAIQIAKDYAIPYYIIDPKNDLNLNLEVYAALCNKVNLIVLAGYLSILDTHFINLYPKKIINIHPSLLPKHGGKGMYGLHIHKKVIEQGDSKTGCTVHYVDSGIDTGKIITQESIDVGLNESPESLQKQVLKLEHKMFAQVIKTLLPYQES